MNPVLERMERSAAQREPAMRCSALPWRISRDGYLEVLLVTADGGGRWGLPIGRRTAACSPRRSAERGAFEEAGVIGDIGLDPVGVYRCSRPCKDGSREPAHVTVFALHVRGTLVTWPDKSLRKRRWRRIDEACQMVEEPGLADLLRSLESGPGSDRGAAVGGTVQGVGTRIPALLDGNPA